MKTRTGKYFLVSAGIGEAVVFTGKYWLSVCSVYFSEPEDPAPQVAEIVTKLR